jgi:hypothetical protein
MWMSQFMGVPPNHPLVTVVAEKSCAAQIVQIIQILDDLISNHIEKHLAPRF